MRQAEFAPRAPRVRPGWARALGQGLEPVYVLSALYPIPELVLIKQEGGILIVKPAAAAAASEVLQNMMAFIPDADHPPDVVTGIAIEAPPGSAEEKFIRRWIDELVMRGFGVIVFLHSVVRGPVRFVATSSPQLMAALAQPTLEGRNYAVLQSPSYLVTHAQQLAQGGTITRELPHVASVHGFTESKAAAEEPPPLPEQGQVAPRASQSFKLDSAGWTTFVASMAGGAALSILLGSLL